MKRWGLNQFKAIANLEWLALWNCTEGDFPYQYANFQFALSQVTVLADRDNDNDK